MRRATLATCILLLTAPALTAQAAEVVDDATGLQVALPDGWSQDATDGETLVSEDPTGAAAVLLVSSEGAAEDGHPALEEILAGLFDEFEGEVPEEGETDGVPGFFAVGAGLAVDEADGSPVDFDWAASVYANNGHLLFVVTLCDNASIETFEAQLAAVHGSISLVGGQAEPIAATAPAGEPGFVLDIAAATNADYQPYEQLVRDSGRLAVVVNDLNTNLALPTVVTIRVGEGDGPLYDPGTNEIILNYDFLQMTDQLFRSVHGDAADEAVQSAVLDVLEWVLYHEVGHALVALYELPITGREEDSVDSLAAVITIAYLEGGQPMAENAAVFWALAGEQAELDDASFWGPHSLDVQRFTAVICWIVGSDPAAKAELATEFEFDEERVQSCAADYEQKVNAWSTLLEPHLRQ